MNPEIHERLPFDQYRQLPGYHATALKWALESALEYQHYELNGLDDSDTLREGRAGHTAVLEPQRFLADYAQYETVREDGTKRIRSGKEWNDFKAANVGKTILTPAQYALACRIRDVVRDHPVAGPLVKCQGHNELSLRWTNKRTGAVCKSRLDRVTPTAIIEIKLTHDISPRVFGNTAAKFRYHLQAAMQRDAAEACGLGRLPHKIIAIRTAKNKPLDTVVYDVGDDLIGQGQEDYERAIDIVQECREKQLWPGVATERAISLFLPAWSTADTEADAVSEAMAIDLGSESIQ